MLNSQGAVSFQQALAQKRMVPREIPEAFAALKPQFEQQWPTWLQQVLFVRGIDSDRALDHSLKQLPSPWDMAGLTEAVTLLHEAKVKNWRILVVGDFDADGATSTAVAVRGLKLLGFESVDYLVPNRFEFGYGLSPEIVQVAATQNPDLLITVDNGIANIDGVQQAKSLGMRVLVTDHHLPGDQLPDADGIVNPNQPDCQFPCKNLAGVGVIFYVLLGLRSHFRSLGLFVDQPEPNLGVLLDIVALGTVADVVPLDQVNRVLVTQGIGRIRRGHAHAGISALIEAGGRQAEFLVAQDLGFTLGPRLNAAGRLDDMSLGIECLLSDSPAKAYQIAMQLNDLNQDRKAIEQEMQQQAENYLAELASAEQAKSQKYGISLFQPQWHQGVIGILASRIKEKYHRPVIIFAPGDQGTLKGSGRSIPGLHLRDALDLLDKQYPGLIEKFGGHAMAAGMSILEKNFQAFSEAFDQIAQQLISDEDLQGTLWIDGQLASQDINLDCAKLVRNLLPWGQGCPEPIFEGYFRVIQQRLLKERHLKLVLQDINQQADYYDAIAFNVNASDWPNLSIEYVRLAYKLDVNFFRGQEQLQLMIEHIEPCAAL